MKFTVLFFLGLIFFISLVSAFSGSGLGTGADPFQITTCDQLNETRNNLTASYILMNDLNFSDCDPSYRTGLGWVPVGQLSGTLDGQGFTIYDLFVNIGSGYFISTKNTRTSVIKNLNFINVSLNNQSLAVVEVNYGEILNVYVQGFLNASPSNAGGLLVWVNEGNVSSCYSSGTVISGSASSGGGLVAMNEASGIIKNSYSLANVSGGCCNAGLVGASNTGGTILNSWSNGHISGTHTLGGLVAYNLSATHSPVLNSFWDVETSGQGSSKGGDPRTTLEMKSFFNYYSAGWDIFGPSSVDVNNGYPFLSYQNNITNSLYIWQIPSIDIPYIPPIGGGGSFLSVGDVLKSDDPLFYWNPDYWVKLKQSFNDLLSGSALGDFPNNLYSFGVFFLNYLLRQPASLGGI